MGYRILGFVVWQGSKWYLRQRLRGARLQLAIGVLAAVIAAGAAAAAQRRSVHSESSADLI